MVSWPFQVDTAVYKLAKRECRNSTRFLVRYLEPSDFKLIQMGKDICYMGIAAKTLDSLVKPELKSEYERKTQVADVGQVEQPNAGSVQTRVQSQPHDRSLLKVLLCRKTGRGRQAKHKRNDKNPKRSELAAFHRHALRPFGRMWP